MRKPSVVEGGALDRLQLRLGLMNLQRPLIVRRALVFSLAAAASPFGFAGTSPHER